MDTTSVAYVLCRIEDDSSLTPVSQHEDIAHGVAAGTRSRSRTSISPTLSMLDGRQRGLLPRGQDRIPPVGHEDRTR